MRAELHVVQAGIQFATPKQFLVPPDVDDAPAFHDHDAIRFQNGGKPVRDDKAGAVEHEVVEGLLNHVFGFGIKGAGGLVQNEQRRILEQGAGNGQALFLAAGKTHAALSDGRFVPLGRG